MQRIAIDRFSRREQRARRSQGQLVAVGAAAADCRCAEAGPRIAACQDDAVQGGAAGHHRQGVATGERGRVALYADRVRT